MPGREIRSFERYIETLMAQRLAPTGKPMEQGKQRVASTESKRLAPLSTRERHERYRGIRRFIQARLG